MNKALGIIKRAHDQGVKLELEEGYLVLNSEDEDIDDDLLVEIKLNKELIIEHFNKFDVAETTYKRLDKDEIKPFDRKLIEKIPLSFSQERLWFLNGLQGSTEYHIPFALKLSGDLNKKALSMSLKEIVIRHEVLRTVILSEEGIAYQRILSPNGWELSFEDVTDDASTLTEGLKTFLSAPFDLGSDYMFRSRLYDLGDNEYVLAGVFHHISSDGWSQGILISEFVKLYRSFVSGKETGLLSLPLQYTDYAVWQRKHLEGAIIDNQLSYWKDQLEGVGTLQLPTDYARPAIRNTSGATLSFELDSTLSKDINSLSRKEGITVFMTLLAAFKVLLSRYSGQEDICVGTPVANRTQKELEGMIGFFVNTLALRTHLKGDISFQELLQEIKQTTLDAYDHQQVPFEKVVEHVIRTRDMSVTPLFQVMFVLQNTPDAATIEMDGLSLCNYEVQGQVTSKFDITITIEETNTGFSVNMNYCTDLFKEETIQRMSVHYQELLKSIVSSPTSQIGDLLMITGEEKHQLLDVFNNTAVNYPKDNTVVDLFEKQAAKTPDAIAVVYEGESLTYRELDERSNQLAHYLINKGTAIEDTVGICMERSLEMIIGIMGILKSGGAYVPIDPDYPQSRIDYMLNDSGIKVLLTSHHCVNRFTNADNLDIILLDSNWDTVNNASKDKIERVASPSNLAYVIYTSGSTGRPKGVMNSHKGMVNGLLWAQDTFKLTPEDVLLQKTNFSFDVSIWELIWPLINGSKLVFVRPGLQGDVVYLRELIETEKVTTIHFVPSMLAVFLAGISSGDCSSLSRVLCSGEALTMEQVRSFRALFPKVRFDNLYGPTEAAVHVSSWSVPEDISSLEKIYIGKPVSNTGLYVLDSSDYLSPVGVVGELCIGGTGVAIGYLNNEELTNEKFVANPFKEEDRIYRTGDLARWLPDGTIEFLGRKDNQVKINGYRIELGEIENVLSLLSGVTHSCVLAKEDSEGNSRLIAYVVMEEDLNKEVLQSQLQERLPEYMVPRLWVQLDEMPITSNGKLDRKALPELDLSTLSTKAYVAPRTETEEQLAAIWQELLGIEKVGIYDNFFEIGGQSLLAIRLISKVQEIGYRIHIRDIFSSPSIAQLSTKLIFADEEYKVPENGIVKECEYITPPMVTLVDLSQEELEIIMNHVPGGAANIQDIYPLAPLQEGIYFHHLMSDTTSGDPYVMSQLLSFSSLNKRSRFIEALNFVINRHDVLRTCVLDNGLSKTVQVVLREVELNVEALSIDEGRDVLLQIKQEQASDNLYIDLVQAPTIQVRIADDAANGEYYLLLNHHHMMMDHIGTAKVIDEIGLYLSGEIDLLPTPSLYRDFVASTLNKEKSEESENYFSSLYSGIEASSYPFHLSDTKMDNSIQFISERAMLSSELRDDIRKISNDLQISPAVLFHAAFGLVVGRCSGTDYALFGSVLLGRLQGAKGSESSLGLFMNTLPVLLDLKGDISSYIAQTNKHLQTLLEHEQTSLSSVHDWSGIPNDIPMFSALLNYRHSTTDHLNTVSNFDGELLSSSNRDNYPFSLDVDDYGNDFGLIFNILSVSISPSSLISYMEEALKKLLMYMDDSSHKSVEELSILTKEETHNLLDLFTNTSVDYPKDKTVVDLFEDHVSNTPDAIALVYGNKSLTYRELDEKSNQLAHYLIDRGVSSDALVGICIKRSLEMIIGILGILKSGGAYVPIDPDFPQSRKDYMLEDSGVKILLSDDKNSCSFSSKESLEVVKLDNDWVANIGEYSTEKLDKTTSPDNLVYVIYTSGSTGMPKGVQIAHRSLMDYFYGLLEKTNISSCRSFGSTSSIATDLGNTILYPCFLTGGTLYILSEDELVDADKITALDLDCLKMVPSHWKALRSKDNLLVPNKSLILGGEAFTDDIFNLLGSNNVSCEVYNHYGPTETTIGKLIHKVDFSKELERPIPLGAPFGNTGVYVLDLEDRLCPIGVVGELCIGGDGLAVGYLNNEELTAEKFVSNPFVEGERMYRTGDLARCLADGNIEFLGRKDNQVKVNGYRIELGEIENVLSRLSGVTQSCVLSKEDSEGNNRLIAYVVLEGELNKESLQFQLQESLPEYMVPKLWLQLNEMPLTSNGKLDRKALPEPDGSELSTKEYVAPRTEIEEQLAGIWQTLLKIEKVGIHDNFFELGGQSLLAIRLIARIRKLGYTVNIGDFYTDPTIALLATKLVSTEEGYKVPENGIVEGCEYITPSMVPLVDLNQKELERIMNHVPGGAANIQDIYPLAPLQEGIYFHHLMSDTTKGDPYVLSQLLSFSSPDKRLEFIDALGFVVNRHDVLRTCVLNEGFSQAIQIVQRKVELKVEELDIDEVHNILPQTGRGQTSNNLYMDLTQAPTVQVKAGDDVVNGKYYLLLNHHHMMMDHIGTSKIIEEIELYLSGRSGLLPTPSLYRDFVGHTLNKEKLEKSKNYFSDLYSTIESPTYPFNLTDTKLDGSTTIISSKTILSAELRDRIRKVSNDLQMSPAVFFHAAFGLVVGRCSGTDYALFGSVLLGRLQGAKGSESSLGLFMNTLPVLLDIKGDIPSYITQTNKCLQSLLDYEQTPLSSIHDWSGIPNEVAMFSALLNYRHSEAGHSAKVPGLDGELLAGYHRTNYPFSLDVDDYSNDFGLTFNISSIGIDPSDLISYVEEALKELLLHIDHSSQKTVEELSILTKEETHQLLEVFNDTAVGYPKDKTIVDLFAEQAAKIPDAIALMCDEKSLTYRELEEKSNQLAYYLIDKGVLVEDLVGICMNRSLEMIVGILGILKSGAAYVPIDPDYPQSRIDYMLEDSGVKILLSDHDIAAKISDKQDLEVESNWYNTISNQSVTKLKTVASPDNLVYVLYTSGSTGNPKGVVMPHKAVFNLISSYYGMGITYGKVTQFNSMSFDVSFLELFFTITQGGALHIVPSELKGDLTGFVDFINKNAIETVFLPTSFFHFIGGENILEKLHPLQHIIVAGEQLQLSEPVIKGLGKLGVTLHNHYGPTEAHVVTTKEVDYQLENIRAELAVLGKPIANTQIYVVSNSLDLVPTGSAGELCIGGDQVARGYLNKESLTHEKFIPNPFKEGERMYRTGDLARWLADGNIEFLGRKDDQVKIRGYRIELGEIENVLSRLPGVTQSCVLAKQDSEGNKRLVAYVVMETELDKEILQSQLEKNMPEYMVPRLWVELNEMPLTSNGKLDRKALPEIDTTALSTKTYIAPRTETEEKLAGIWQELLKVDKVGIHDNFFELGGHSLLATRLVSMIRKELDVEMTIRDVFAYTTIDSLGAYLLQQEKGIVLPEIIKIEERPDKIPLSFSQERLWFLDRLQGSAEYHLPFALRLSGDLDKKALSLSLKEIVTRHEALRTIIHSEEGVGYQEVVSPDQWELSFKDITDKTSSLPEDLKLFLSSPFDLGRDYMFRSCLYDLGSNEYVLAGVFHHIASDGWSQGILISEFVELYRSYISGKEAGLLPLPLQYTDYALWQRNNLEGSVIEDQLSYWAGQLEDVSILELPTDYRRPAMQSISGATLSFNLDSRLSKEINSLSQNEGATVFMTLLAAFKVLLKSYSGQDDICVGTPVANRTRKELEGMIGFFVNTLALRTQFTEDTSFRELLQEVKQTTLDAYDHQQVPFEKVVERVVSTRDMGVTPLFQVMFVLQNTPDTVDIEMDGLTLSHYKGHGHITSKFDITMAIEESESGFSVNLNYCTDLFNEETMQRMSVHYQELLKSIVSSPTSQIGDLSMLTEEETHQLLEVFNDTAVDYPKDKTVVDLFAEQAAKTPDATAVVYEGENLTYRELDDRSNQLAHYLIDKGVLVEDLVGICMNRSLEMIVGILGILKSGAAYVPIDPAYPEDRINFMIKDASANILLSTSGIANGILGLEVDELVLLDTVSTNLEKVPKSPLNIDLSVDNLAYVIYTSGSTGKPKGVQVEHKNIVSLATSCDYVNLNNETVWLSTGAISFDATTIEYWGTLLNGGKLVLTTTDTLLKTSLLKTLILENKVTTLWMTASWFHQVVEEDVTVFKSLNYLLVGGDTVLFNYTNKVKGLYPELTIVNGYGPTENTTFSTTYTIEITEDALPIGKPIKNAYAYITDKHMNLVPAGAVGELVVGGSGVARGYLNDNELMNERFVNSPFKEGDRLYKTGDLAKWLPDGNIEFIGRKDDQVKIRGYRIELGEIENTLSSVPEVSQCCVLVKTDEQGDKRLVAYVVMETELDKEALQVQLQESLPEYMVPKLWIQLNEMPLTLNGKLNRKALPEIDTTTLSTKAYVAPRTETEERLAAIWQELLGIEKVGIYDNFFELGGHSLLAVRLIISIQKEFDIEVSIQDVFEFNCIEQLSNYIQYITLEDADFDDEIFI